MVLGGGVYIPFISPLTRGFANVIFGGYDDSSSPTHWQKGHDPIIIKTLNDLIGEVGELMLMNVEADLIVTASERECLEKKLKKRTSKLVSEPRFD